MSTSNAGDYMMQASAVALEPAGGNAVAMAPASGIAALPAAPMAEPQAQSMVNNINVNVGMPAAAMPSIQFNAAKTGPNFFVRAIWFVFVGSWLSAFFILAGYALVASLIFLPFGIYVLNRVPQAQTLRARTREFTTEMRGNTLVFTEGRKQQHPWYLRLLYLPIGLFLGAIWLIVAWVLSITVIGLPLSVLMIDRAPSVVTLQKN